MIIALLGVISSGSLVRFRDLGEPGSDSMFRVFELTVLYHSLAGSRWLLMSVVQYVCCGVASRTSISP